MKLCIARVLTLVVLAGCAGSSNEAARPAAAAPTVASAPAAASAPLDGRKYDVTLEIPDAAPVKDTLVFANGRFESTACTSLGFPEWSDYAVRVDADGVSFHVIARHPSGTTMDWNGSIKGDSVDGTAHRTTNGKTDVLRFRGALHS